jgi:glycosyltransferase involved in cell wall biosynthesis
VTEHGRSEPVDVSVVIPAFNSEWCVPQLAENIRSCCKGCEVIFVDDGSSDAGLTQFKSLVPDAICIRQENQGVGAARNRGVETATRTFVQLLDADDTLMPGKFTAQLDTARRTGADIVFSDWQMLEFWPGRSIAHPVTQSGDPDDVVAALLGGWWFPTASALVRKAAYVECGGCDIHLRDTCDDFHVWVQMAIRSARFEYCPGVYSNYHRYHDRSSISRRDPMAFFSGEATIIRNALSALEARGGLDASRRRAAATRMHHVARNVYKIDKPTYKSLMTEVRQIDPFFSPSSGTALYRSIWRLAGDEPAEWLALYYGKVKQTAGAG